jgi:selenoprotein W-related protein
MAGPRVEITYCRRCKFLLRATWLGTEILTAFPEEIGELAIVPGSGGIFEVKLDGEVVATNRGGAPIPDAAEVKRALRDRIAPERRIGHE